MSQARNRTGAAVALSDLPDVRPNTRPNAEDFEAFDGFFRGRRGRTVKVEITRPKAYTLYMEHGDGDDTEHTCESVQPGDLVLAVVDHAELQRQGADVMAGFAAQGWLRPLSDKAFAAALKRQAREAAEAEAEGEGEGGDAGAGE